MSIRPNTQQKSPPSLRLSLRALMLSVVHAPGQYRNEQQRVKDERAHHCGKAGDCGWVDLKLTWVTAGEAEAEGQSRGRGRGRGRGRVR